MALCPSWSGSASPSSYTCSPTCSLHLVQCYDREDFPRTNNDMERSIRGRKHAVSPGQWSQELERLSLTLRALGRLRRLVGARRGPSPTSATACRPAGPYPLARTATGDHGCSEPATHALSFPSQAPRLTRFP